MHRPVVATTAAVLATLSLAACTSQTQACKSGVCDIDLSGAGATVELGGDGSGGSDLKLVGASGRLAQIEIDSKPSELTIGQPVQLSNGTLELVEVEGEDDVQIKVTGSAEGAADGATDEDPS